MSNLGAYQWFTTVAKKVGGPINLLLISAGAGATVYKSSELLIKKGVKVIKAKVDRKKSKEDIKQYVVKTAGTSNEGLKFEVGEKFNVLAADGIAILIEKIGDENNPYFVSEEFLKKISNY